MSVMRRAWWRTRSPFSVVPPLLYQCFPQALWAGNPARREIALTYDDGPHLRDTPQLIDVLARHEIAASFCLLGELVERQPNLVAALVAAGHQIGLHGYRHRPFVFDSLPVLREHLARTQTTIANAAHHDPASIRWVRPPFGLFTPGLLRSLIAWDYLPMLGTMIPMHWQMPLELSVTQVMRFVQPGSLIVLHESHDGPSVAAITDALIPRLKAAGYRFVNLDQMWEARAP